ncbi:Alpha-L-fucosidase [compost metagenome]
MDYDWEACYTLNNSWGFKRSDIAWKSPEEVNKKLVAINAQGGNLLLNIGPDGNGEVPAISKEILLKAAAERKDQTK